MKWDGYIQQALVYMTLEHYNQIVYSPQQGMTVIGRSPGVSLNKNVERLMHMKKVNKFMGYLVIIMVIFFFAGCGSAPHRESTGEFIDDTVITTKVKAKLGADEFLKLFKISVDTFKGQVRLSGVVNYKEEIERADNIAKSVQGVKSVKNDLVTR